MPGLMFATGIENSYPVVKGNIRIDEMAKCGHYERWQEDLRLCDEMNIRYLRWGPAIYKTFLAPGVYDWDFTDAVVARMRELRIVPIMDLLHFGLPDWLGTF